MKETMAFQPRTQLILTMDFPSDQSGTTIQVKVGTIFESMSRL